MTSQSRSLECLETLNSTDCLLRLVVEALDKQDQEAASSFDWDPISFAFTAPIGIFALLFAAVTIWQAILASGQGRRKSNYRAIGPWSEKTRYDWSWRDLNRLAIATTPVLKISQIYSAIESTSKRKPETDSNRDSQESLQNGTVGKLKGWVRRARSKRHKSKILRRLGRLVPRLQRVRGEDNKKPLPKDSDLPTATWYRFLEQVALNETTQHPGSVETVTTMADYLPDDLLAVPAYAEVGFIVAASAAAGIQSLTLAGDVASQSSLQYPVILGRGWQFDFRPHPTLGTVAAFSQYGNFNRAWMETGRGSEPELLRQRMHQKTLSAFVHASGDVAVVGPTERYMRCTRNQLTGTLRNLVKEKAKSTTDTDLQVMDGLLSDDYGISWILLMDTPNNYVPAIFPTTLVRRNAGILSMLALNSKFWSSPTLSSRSYVDKRLPIIPTNANVTASKVTSNHYTEYSDLDDPEIPDGMSAERLEVIMQVVEHGTFPPGHGAFSTGRLQDISLCHFVHAYSSSLPFLVLPAIVKQCVVMLHGYDEFQGWFVELSPLEKQYFRALLVLQIRRVEEWIKCVYGDHSCIVKRLATLITTTLALLKTSVWGRHNNISEEGKKWRSVDLSGAQEDIPVMQNLQTIVQLDQLITNFPPEEWGAQSGIMDFNDATITKSLAPELKHMIDGLYGMFDGESKRREKELGHHEAGLPDQPPAQQNKEEDIERDLQTLEVSTKPAGLLSARGNEGTSGHGQLEADQAGEGDMEAGGAEEGGEADRGETSGANDHRDEEATDEGPKVVFEDDEGIEDPRTATEILDDVLVWKAIMVAMLFYTAPDNSVLLRSGIWEHVVPVM
ncbi:hypothetical protein QBC44DRAFT_1587 [Cladorrhinum sp. PSN332]|nr:hypothetical protein QBC44DRAFT_1587 [Cladorrhinum sp. PSN332]